MTDGSLADGKRSMACKESHILCLVKKKHTHLLNGSDLIDQKRMIAKACHQEEGL